MGAYLIRRLLLVIPTLFGIIAINFVVVQFAPGGPVEQMLAELRGRGGDTMGRLTGGGTAEVAARAFRASNSRCTVRYRIATAEVAMTTVSARK